MDVAEGSAPATRLPAVLRTVFACDRVAVLAQGDGLLAALAVEPATALNLAGWRKPITDLLHVRELAPDEAVLC